MKCKKSSCEVIFMSENIVQKSNCCCSIREAPCDNQQGPVKKTPVTILLSFFESVSGQLILAGVSGVCLFVSLFGLLGGHLPFDPAWVAILLSGTPLFVWAIQAILERRITAEVLVATAILATIYTGEIFAGGEVAFIMMLGHLLENWTIRRARAGIEKLIRLTPRTARRIDETGRENVVEVSEIQSGETLRVLPGDAVPVDGRILFGNTSIDQQLLTGEPLPVDKKTGEEVFAGTINRFGAFTMQATKVGEDSSLARMIRLVREAEAKKARLERITDRWASYLVPAAILTAVLVGLMTQDIMRAVTILVVFCPCSLVLATPTAIIAAIGNASRYGILIRSGEVLELLGRIKSLAFDKTGTLTLGKPTLSRVRSLSHGRSEEELLTLAASLEQSSQHPLSLCIVEAATAKGLPLFAFEDSRVIPGRGIVGRGKRIEDREEGKEGREQEVRNEKSIVDAEPSCCCAKQNRPMISEQTSTPDSPPLSSVLCPLSSTVLIGNEKLLRENGIDISEAAKAEAGQCFDRGETVVWVAIGPEIAGFLAIADSLRESAAATVRQLQAEKVEVLLLTGDNPRAAKSIAKRAGIANFETELLPEDKQRLILARQQSGEKIAMVGDGINDAPALKTADVGIAMGKIGSDLAIEAADITLVGDDISRVPFLVRLSRKTIRTILGNIALSMSINAVAIVLATTGLIGPVIGALVHNVGSVLVVFNASLLLGVRWDYRSRQESRGS